MQRQGKGPESAPQGPGTHPQEILVIGSVVTAVITVIFFFMFLFGGGGPVTYTWGLVLLPVAVGFGVVGLIAFYEFALQRMRRALVVLLCVLAVAGFSLAMAMLFAYGNPHPLGEASVWWLLVAAIGWVGLTLILDKLMPPPRVESGPVDDDAWRRRLSGDLRLRAGISEAQLKVALAQAEEQAAGGALYQQLGPPEAYARRFPRDRAAERRLQRWFWTAFVVLAAYLALSPVAEAGWAWSELPWYGVAAFLIALAAAVSSWVQHFRRTSEFGRS